MESNTICGREKDRVTSRRLIQKSGGVRPHAVFFCVFEFPCMPVGVYSICEEGAWGTGRSQINWITISNEAA